MSCNVHESADKCRNAPRLKVCASLKTAKNAEMEKQACFQRHKHLAVGLRSRTFTAIVKFGSNDGELISTGRLRLENFEPETLADYREKAKRCIIFYLVHFGAFNLGF